MGGFALLFKNVYFSKKLSTSSLAYFRGTELNKYYFCTSAGEGNGQPLGVKFSNVTEIKTYNKKCKGGINKHVGDEKKGNPCDKKDSKKPNIVEISGKIQQYDWGKQGEHSLVAALHQNVNGGFTIEKDKPYAELWFGTHVNAPSDVKEGGQSLLCLLKEKPDYLGGKIKEAFGVEELPFLLKVLSIQKALSIQVHPDKKKAELLHRKFPDVYKDANHKPEIAIALTQFEALCGFRPYKDIKKFFTIIPELEELVGTEFMETFLISDGDTCKWALRACFRTLLTTPPEEVARFSESYLHRTKDLSDKEKEEQLRDLFVRLNDQFPNDIGCFSIFFLNYLSLNPMEAIFLEANLPHAYLSGDCVECMACSDNVVRAGLTPKFRDVETLCEMLNYDGEPAECKIFVPERQNEYISLFQPPIPDFAVARILVCKKISECPLPIRDSASILLVIMGTAKIDDTPLVGGTSLFIPAGQNIVLKDVSEKFLAFQAIANV